MRIAVRDPQRRSLGDVVVDLGDLPSALDLPSVAGSDADGGADSSDRKSEEQGEKALAVGASGADSAPNSHVKLEWEEAFAEDGSLKRCPVCGCRELFFRRDFPQHLGLAVVVMSAIFALALFAMNQILLGMGILAGVVLIDLILFCFAGRCVVCYRCRSEYRDVPIGDREGFDLAVGEKYRPMSHD